MTLKLIQFKKILERRKKNKKDVGIQKKRKKFKNTNTKYKSNDKNKKQQIKNTILRKKTFSFLSFFGRKRRH